MTGPKATVKTTVEGRPEVIELVDHIPPLVIVAAILIGVVIGAVVIAVFTETDHDA